MTTPNRLKKEARVTELKTKFAGMNSVAVAQYSGINVEKITKLRASLRENGVNFEVIKNKLSSRAVAGTPLEPLKTFLKGPVALAYSSKDPIAFAKTLKSFADTEEKFLIQASVLDGTLLDKSQFIELAKVPSREVLLSRLVGSMQNTYASMVYVLGAIMRKADASSAESEQPEEKKDQA